MAFMPNTIRRPNEPDYLKNDMPREIIQVPKTSVTEKEKKPPFAIPGAAEVANSITNPDFARDNAQKKLLDENKAVAAGTKSSAAYQAAQLQMHNARSAITSRLMGQHGLLNAGQAAFEGARLGGQAAGEVAMNSLPAISQEKMAANQFAGNLEATMRDQTRLEKGQEIQQAQFQQEQQRIKDEQDFQHKMQIAGIATGVLGLGATLGGFGRGGGNTVSPVMSNIFQNRSSAGPANRGALGDWANKLSIDANPYNYMPRG